MKYLFLIFGFFSAQAFSQDIAQTKLKGVDGKSFQEIIKGFQNDEVIEDPNDERLWFRVRTFKTENESIALVCQTRVFMGSDGATECEVRADMEKSSDVVQIQKSSTVERAIIVTFQSPAVATQFFRNNRFVNYATSEKVKLAFNGSEIEYPRLKLNCEREGATDRAKKCTLVFIRD